MGFAGLREPALRLRRDVRPDHFPRVPREGPPGRRRYENQCKDPPFATSFFLAQAELALKGAKDGAPGKQGRPEKRQVSGRERHGGKPGLKRTARRGREDARPGANG